MPPKNLHNTYHPPPPRYLSRILLSGLLMALSTSRLTITAPSPIHTYLLSGSSPTILRAAAWVQSGLFFVLFGAHAVGTVAFTRRLREHGVASGTGAWWAWVGTGFLGGRGCWAWFEEVVGGREE